MNYGDPLGDPQGILRGSYPKTGDPAFVRHIKIGGSGETTYPLYNINRGEGEKRWAAGEDAEYMGSMPDLVLWVDLL